MGQFEIPVVLITDSNYILATKVAIRSLLRYRKPGTRYRVFVLGVSLSRTDRFRLRHGCGALEILDVPVGRYREFSGFLPHVSAAAFYKFNLADLLSQYEKIIYLDSDMLVLDDLSELFAVDISTEYAAMVRDYPGMVNPDWKMHEKLHLRNYFNSGMMLINAARWRREELYGKFLEIKKNNVPDKLMDQDVFNLAFHDCVKILPSRYNCPAMFDWGPEEDFRGFFSDGELPQIEKFRRGEIVPGETVILHYFRPDKPWITLRGDVYKCFWWRFLTPGEAVRLYGKKILRRLVSELNGSRREKRRKAGGNG